MIDSSISYYEETLPRTFHHELQSQCDTIDSTINHETSSDPAYASGSALLQKTIFPGAPILV